MNPKVCFVNGCHAPDVCATLHITHEWELHSGNLTSSHLKYFICHKCYSKISEIVNDPNIDNLTKTYKLSRLRPGRWDICHADDYNIQLWIEDNVDD